MNGLPRRLAFAGVLAAAFAALPLAGCTSGSDTNGLEDKSSAEVLQEAAAALKAAASVRVTAR